MFSFQWWGNVSGPKIETQTWVFWYLLIIREAFSIVIRLVEAIGSGLGQLMSVNVLDGSQSTETSNLVPQKPRFPIDVFISNQPTSILVGNMNLPTVFLIFFTLFDFSAQQALRSCQALVEESPYFLLGRMGAGQRRWGQYLHVFTVQFVITWIWKIHWKSIVFLITKMGKSVRVFHGFPQYWFTPGKNTIKTRQDMPIWIKFFHLYCICVSQWTLNDVNQSSHMDTIAFVCVCLNSGSESNNQMKHMSLLYNNS